MHLSDIFFKVILILLHFLQFPSHVMLSVIFLNDELLQKLYFLIFIFQALVCITQLNIKLHKFGL